MGVMYDAAPAPSICATRWVQRARLADTRMYVAKSKAASPGACQGWGRSVLARVGTPRRATRCVPILYLLTRPAPRRAACAARRRYRTDGNHLPSPRHCSIAGRAWLYRCMTVRVNVWRRRG